MSNAYLLKTEPSEYSFANLKRDKKAGDRLVIYETGDRKAAVGTAAVVSVKVTDPKSPQVEVAAGKELAKPITLAEIKSNKLFAASPLVKIGRLSVVTL